MTLEEIYYVSQIVAVIAIFASLIFVGVQIRQNTRATRASAAFEGTHSWAVTNELFVANVSDDFLLMVIATYDPAKTWNDFAEADRARATLGHRALFQKLEGLYFLHKYGNLDNAIWDARLSWAAGVIKLPFYRQWWDFEKTQNIWSGEFVAIVETACDTTGVVPWDASAYRNDGAEAKLQSGTPKS